MILSSCDILTIAPDGANDLLPTTVLSTNNVPAVNEVRAIEFVKLVSGERGSGTFPLVQNIVWRVQAFRTVGRRCLIQVPAFPPGQFNSVQMFLQSTPHSGSLPLGMLGGVGSTTCNATQFAYALTASRITIRDVASTLIACDPLRMTIERLYLFGLPRATS